MGTFASPEALLETAVEKRWTLKQLTDAYVEETLRRAGGNRTLAARRLGVSRKSLWERGKRRKAAESGSPPARAEMPCAPRNFSGIISRSKSNPPTGWGVEGGESTS